MSNSNIDQPSSPEEINFEFSDSELAFIDRLARHNGRISDALYIFIDDFGFDSDSSELAMLIRNRLTNADSKTVLGILNDSDKNSEQKKAELLDILKLAKVRLIGIVNQIRPKVTDATKPVLDNMLGEVDTSFLDEPRIDLPEGNSLYESLNADERKVADEFLSAFLDSDLEGAKRALGGWSEFFENTGMAWEEGEMDLEKDLDELLSNNAETNIGAHPKKKYLPPPTCYPALV